MAYRIFKRSWWKPNPRYPNGLEPNSTCRKTTLAYRDTEAEAQQYCREWNACNKPGRFSIKAEYE